MGRPSLILAFIAFENLVKSIYVYVSITYELSSPCMNTIKTKTQKHQLPLQNVLEVP